MDLTSNPRPETETLAADTQVRKPGTFHLPASSALWKTVFREDRFFLVLSVIIVRSFVTSNIMGHLSLAFLTVIGFVEVARTAVVPGFEVTDEKLGVRVTRLK